MAAAKKLGSSLKSSRNPPRGPFRSCHAFPIFFIQIKKQKTKQNKTKKTNKPRRSIYHAQFSKYSNSHTKPVQSHENIFSWLTKLFFRVKSPRTSKTITGFQCHAIQNRSNKNENRRIDKVQSRRKERRQICKARRQNSGDSQIFLRQDMRRKV